MNEERQVHRLRILLMLACLLSGLLAGSDVHRYLIEVPGWRSLDKQEWVEYSLHADLGNGIFLFPIEALGSFSLLVMIFYLVRKQAQDGFLRWTIVVALITSAAGLAFTYFAAPVMLQLKETPTLPPDISFDRFHYWGMWRALVQTLSFVFIILALGKISSR